MISIDEVQQWHQIKNEYGPTFSGSKPWRKYLEFLEKKLLECGVIDIEKNKWKYERWYTSDWPDNSNWSLSIEGTKIHVAHYGAYSGKTGDEGITAELILFDFQMPPESVKDKIVVIKSPPHPDPPYSEDYKAWFTISDYEYITDSETMPSMFERIFPETSVTTDVWWQIMQLRNIYSILIENQAAGCIAIFDMPYDRIASMYTFPVPMPYDAPTLYLDREAGKQVIEDAKNGKKATIRLISTTETTETYQLVGYLPGNNYGNEDDKEVLLVTHTDGPCISQDNGALGVLAIVSNISKIPQDQREKTLLIMLDNCHYMPGLEYAYAEYDWFNRFPGKKERIDSYVSVEHLGQLEYRETGTGIEPTGFPEVTYFWASENEDLIGASIKAVNENALPRTVLKCVTRLGFNGQSQGIWLGRGMPEHQWGLPGCALMGVMGAYWTTNSGIDMFNAEHFVRQVNVMTQMTEYMMNSEIK